MKSCSFFGHRNVLDKIDESLFMQIEYAINTLGVNTFYVGGYGEFDNKVVEVIGKIKNIYPDIKLLLAVAYLPIKEYDTMYYDGTIFFDGLEFGVKRFAIGKRNRLMVDASDVIICYITHNHGGAYTASNYAKKMGKVILNCIENSYFTQKQKM